MALVFDNMVIKIGTSGYKFDEWKGVLYPRNIKKSDMIKFYSDIFKVVEIAPENVEEVEKNTKEDMKYFVKGSSNVDSVKFLGFSDKDRHETDNFIFIRLNNDFYSRKELLELADKLFSYNKDVYVLFANHKDGNAAKNAIMLQHIVRNVE